MIAFVLQVIRRRHLRQRRGRSMRPSIHHDHDNYSLSSLSTMSGLRRAKGQGRQSLRSVTSINHGFMADEVVIHLGNFETRVFVQKKTFVNDSFLFEQIIILFFGIRIGRDFPFGYNFLLIFGKWDILLYR